MRLSPRFLVLLVMLLLGLGIGAYLAWSSPRENPILAGIPLRERMKGLDSTDPLTRKRTIYTLAAFGPRAKGALPDLVKRFDEETTGLDTDAAVAIGRMREAALPELKKILAEKKPPSEPRPEAWAKERQWHIRRRLAVVALGYAGPCAIPTLRELLGDNDEYLVATVRSSLTRIAAEHPETIPDLAAELSSVDWDRLRPTTEELYSAARRSPDVRQLWLSLLNHPSAAAQLTATRVLSALGVLDPRMIPSLVILNGDRDDWIERKLLTLHRSGHNIIPAVMARWRARANTGSGNRRACFKLLLAVGADADGLVPEFRKHLWTDAADDACSFLAAAEKRRAEKETLPGVVGGVGVTVIQPSLIPDLLDRLCAPLEGNRWAYHRAAGAALDELFPHAQPYLSAALQDVPTRRDAVLSYLSAHYSGNFERRTNEEPKTFTGSPVPEKITRAIVALLADLETREKAIVLLGEMGPPARSAVVDLLAQLDETHLDALVTAIGRIAEFDPTQADRLTHVRIAFAKKPKRVMIVQRLRKKLAEFRGTNRREEIPGFRAAMILLALHESMDEVIAAFQKRPEGSPCIFEHLQPLDFAASLAAADSLVFEKLLDLNQSYLDQVLPNRVVSQGPRSEKIIPALLRRMERSEYSVQSSLEALAFLCEHQTPQGVASSLSKRLANDGLQSGHAVLLLRALARIAPNGDRITIPEKWRNANEVGVHRMAAAAALRWNPKDAVARRVVLDWAFAPQEAVSLWFDPAGAVAALAPLASTDPEALAALVQFLEKAPADPSTLKAILTCGKGGINAVVKRFTETGNEKLAQVLLQLATDGQVSLQTVFAEARRAGRSFAMLLPITTNETAPELLEMAVGANGAQSPLESFTIRRDSPTESTTYALRWPTTFSKLRRWVSEDDVNRRDFAFSILSHTHPDDPVVCQTGLVLSMKPWYARTYAWTWIQTQREKGVAILRVQLDFPNSHDRADALDRLEQLLRALPDGYVEALLTDPDARVRGAAVRAMTRRLSRDRQAPLAQRDAQRTRIVQRLGRILSEEGDPSVRTAAWHGINVAQQDAIQAAQEDGHPRAVVLQLLSGEQRTAWGNLTVALYQKDKARPNRIDSFQRHLEIWAGMLDISDVSDLQNIRMELERTLPPPTSEGAQRSAQEVVSEFLGYTAEMMYSEDGAAKRRQLRAEIIRRGATEPEIARALGRANFLGDPHARRPPVTDRRALSTMRDLGPRAVPTLIELCNRAEMPSALLIEVLGDGGPTAQEAVPLLLPLAGDPQYERRQAARATLRKLAPEAAAELD